MNRVLHQLNRDLELEGYTPGTEQFDIALRERKVGKCQEMQGVPSCNSCPAFMGCELVKAHRRDLAFGGKRKKADVVMGLARKMDEPPKKAEP